MENILEQYLRDGDKKKFPISENVTEAVTNEGFTAKSPINRTKFKEIVDSGGGKSSGGRAVFTFYNIYENMRQHFSCGTDI